MAYATIDDVAAELGRATPEAESADGVRWQGWLDRVERSIVRGFTRRGLVLAEQVADGNVSVNDVRDVEVVRVAARVEMALANGLTSATVTIDDGTVTQRREHGEGYDPLQLTPADWETLLPDAPVSGGRIFSVMPS